MYDYDYFQNIVHQVTSKDCYQQMKKYIHHGNVTCFEHCYNVALYSYIFAIKHKCKVDMESLIRGALLHDYFLYDWHITKGRKRLHGYRHPKIAYKNAIKDYKINKVEKDIIIKHMWPLTLSLPRYKETFIVLYADKMVAVQERYSLVKKNA